MRLCQGVGYLNALGVYFIDTESISGINNSRKNRVGATAPTQNRVGATVSTQNRFMPISLLLGASETDVVSSCRDVRGVRGKERWIFFDFS